MIKMTIKQFLINHWYIPAGLIGIFSGVFVTFIGEHSASLGALAWTADVSGFGYGEKLLPFKYVISFLPGLFFGITTSLYFLLVLPVRSNLEKHHISMLRACVRIVTIWTIGSTISYFIAFWSGYLLLAFFEKSIFLPTNIASLLGFMIAGWIGSSILARTFSNFLAVPLAAKYEIKLQIAGAVFATISHLIPTLGINIGVYLIWQTAIMLMFGYVINSLQKSKSLVLK